MYQHYRNVYFGALESVLCRKVVYMVSLFGESFIEVPLHICLKEYHYPNVL